MKLNNKGFAISTILYSLLLLASMILLLLFANLSGNKKTNDDFVSQIEDELNTCVLDGSC